MVNPRLETMSREVFRHPDLAPLVELNRIRDHFICMYCMRIIIVVGWGKKEKERPGWFL